MVIDPVYMIREESSNTMIKLGESMFDEAWLERVTSAKLEELVSHERFMLRIQTIHMINQMKGQGIITYQLFFSTECKCNLQGSKNNNCRPDSGKCECKDGYSGIHCELSIGENIYCLLILE